MPRRSATRTARRFRTAAVALPLIAAPLAIAALLPSSASASTPVNHVGKATAATATANDFTQIFQDDFNGSALNGTAWGVYDNPTAKAHRTRANIAVNNGMASLKTQYSSALQTWTAAGMSATRNKSLIQTYGKYEMRVQVSAGDSRVVALLWPAKGWPPEIDFMEMGGQNAQGTRQQSTQTLHYGPQNAMIHTNVNADMTQWHTVGVQWTPREIDYTLDGVVTNSVTGPAVPSQPMWMGLQTAAGKGHTPTVPVNVNVDYVKIYKYTPTP
jgi:beta-glucanase (GH16 family)